MGRPAAMTMSSGLQRIIGRGLTENDQIHCTRERDQLFAVPAAEQMPIAVHAMWLNLRTEALLDDVSELGAG
jgi:hypothetical protein